MGGNILFPTMYQAVEKLMHCCDEISPIARSEVFNETWMLRLTLALLHDYTDVFSIEEGKKTIMEDIQRAVRKRWISEGGLHPAFKNEGPTWADAVVGDIGLGKKMKREIVVNIANKPITGVMVIEAKIGSKLSEGITHEKKNYNQAARNIACLARLVQDQGKELIKNSRFVLFGPREKVKHWKGCEHARNCIQAVEHVISMQNRGLNLRKDKPDSSESFKKVLGEIKSQSTAMSWEDIIDATSCGVLDCFYQQVLNETLKTRKAPHS